MTLVITWTEEDVTFLAADTRLTANGRILSDSTSKIFPISVSFCQTWNGFIRLPYFYTVYGFAFSGHLFPGVMTSATSSALFQTLVTDSSTHLPALFSEIVVRISAISQKHVEENLSIFKKMDRQDSFIIGFCARNQRDEIYHISHLIEEKLVTTEVKSVSADRTTPHAIGSGAEKFIEYFVNNRVGRTDRFLPIRLMQAFVNNDNLRPRDVSKYISLGIICGSPRSFTNAFIVDDSVIVDPFNAIAFNGIDVPKLIGPIGDFDYRVGGPLVHLNSSGPTGGL